MWAVWRTVGASPAVFTTVNRTRRLKFAGLQRWRHTLIAVYKTEAPQQAQLVLTMTSYIAILLGALVFVQNGLSNPRKHFHQSILNPICCNVAVLITQPKGFYLTILVITFTVNFSTLNISPNDTNNRHCDLQASAPGAYCKIWSLSLRANRT